MTIVEIIDELECCESCLFARHSWEDGLQCGGIWLTTREEARWKSCIHGYNSDTATDSHWKPWGKGLRKAIKEIRDE